jgi:hypothetical protein
MASVPICKDCKWYSPHNPTRDVPKHTCLHAVDMIHGMEWPVPVFEARKSSEPYTSCFISRDPEINTYGLLFMPCGPAGRYFEPKRENLGEPIPVDLAVRICAKFGRWDSDHILHEPLIRHHAECDTEQCPATLEYAELTVGGRVRGAVRHERFET